MQIKWLIIFKSWVQTFACICKHPGGTASSVRIQPTPLKSTLWIMSSCSCVQQWRPCHLARGSGLWRLSWTHTPCASRCCRPHCKSTLKGDTHHPLLACVVCWCLFPHRQPQKSLLKLYGVLLERSGGIPVSYIPGLVKMFCRSLDVAGSPKYYDLPLLELSLHCVLHLSRM